MMQKTMMRASPIRIPITPKNSIRKILFKLVESKMFDNFILIMIILNTVILCLDYYGSSKTYRDVINKFNIVFVAIFALEAVLKIVSYDLRYYVANK